MSASQKQFTYSQNFLRDPRLVRYLLHASSIAPSDLVYEIGPGKGIITEVLAETCRRLIAVEKDVRLANGLQARLGLVPNLDILPGDFLDVELPQGAYKVFANVPFTVTSAVISKLASAQVLPDDSYLIVQREAAERFLGRPVGTLYAALLYPHFDPSVLYRFDRSDFAPTPGVDIVMLRLRKRGPPLVPPAVDQDYRDFVSYCFTSRHRTLRGTLGTLLGGRTAGRILFPLGLGPEARPSTVCVEQWTTLWSGFHLLSGPDARREVAGAERLLRLQQEGLSKLHRTRASSKQHLHRGRPTDAAL